MPEVAVTVTVDVTEFAPLFPLLPEPDPPPQPLMQPMPKMQTASMRSFCRVRRRRKPRKQRERARVAPPGSNESRLGRRLALPVVVAIVRVVAAPPPEAVTVDGEKLQIAPVGNPVQAKETAAANPFCDVMVIVEVPLEPALTVSEVGESATPKSAGGLIV